MRSLTEFLKSLPGVMPIKAADAIYYDHVLSDEARRDIYARSSSYLDNVRLVGPDAAAALLAAYRDGRLPMKRGAKVQGAPEAE